MKRAFRMLLPLLLVALAACAISQIHHDNARGKSAPVLTLAKLKKRLPCLNGQLKDEKTTAGLQMKSCRLDPPNPGPTITVYAPFDNIKTVMLVDMPSGSLNQIRPDVKVLANAVVAICHAGTVANVQAWINEALKSSADGPAGSTLPDGRESITAESRDRTLGGWPVHLNASSQHHGGQLHLIQIIVGRGLD